MISKARVTLAGAIAVLGLAASGAAATISPTFDTFGTLSGATFGGSGIPNDAVAITTITDGANTITLGLTAHQRFVGPNLANNGAGIFTAEPGGFQGPPPDPTLSRWNFAFYINIVGGGTFDDYMFDLLYDFDPGAGTDETDLGVLDFDQAIIAAMGTPGAVTLVQDSQNPGFGFLATASSFITPPTTSSFDPNAVGEYTFALRAFNTRGLQIGQSAIQVSTVPEPLSASLFGLGALGLAIGAYRRRNKAPAASV